MNLGKGSRGPAQPGEGPSTRIRKTGVISSAGGLITVGWGDGYKEGETAELKGLGRERGGVSTARASQERSG